MLIPLIFALESYSLSYTTAYKEPAHEHAESLNPIPSTMPEHFPPLARVLRKVALSTERHRKFGDINVEPQSFQKISSDPR